MTPSLFGGTFLSSKNDIFLVVNDISAKSIDWIHSKMVSINMMWFLVKKLQIFEIYLYFCHFLPKYADVIENFGHKTCLRNFLQSSYDCQALAPFLAS